MTISAKVICDSVAFDGQRVTTLQCRYPKFIHGEFMTHRVFSRNASSSRAIPIARLIQDVMEDPAMPVFWGKNQKGMQANEEILGEDHKAVIDYWLEAREVAVDYARVLERFNLHKQIINRILEPWCHINVIVTATEWANFFALRRHKDAQPEMKALADVIYIERENSVPKYLDFGEWHLPYVDIKNELNLLPSPPSNWPVEPGDRYKEDSWFRQLFIKMSVARCARVSYKTHDGNVPNIEEDLKLYDRLVGSKPLHASPAEHQCTPDRLDSPISPHLWGNLKGFIQYRKMLPNECA